MATDCSEEAKQRGNGSVQKTMAFYNGRNQLRPHSPVTSRPSRRPLPRVPHNKEQCVERLLDGLPRQILYILAMRYLVD